jgi:hypothetical protein
MDGIVIGILISLAAVVWLAYQLMHRPPAAAVASSDIEKQLDQHIKELNKQIEANKKAEETYEDAKVKYMSKYRNIIKPK